MNILWEKAPEWAKYAAMDMDAEWWWYETRPEYTVSGIWIIRGKCERICLRGDRELSKNSLQERPK